MAGTAPLGTYTEDRVALERIITRVEFPWTDDAFADPDSVEELAYQIQKVGLLINPITVQALSCGSLAVVAGAQRLHALRIAGAEEVPVHILDAADHEAVMVSISENVNSRGQSLLLLGWRLRAYIEFNARLGSDISIAHAGRLAGLSTSRASEIMRVADALTPSLVRRVCTQVGVPPDRLVAGPFQPFLELVKSVAPSDLEAALCDLLRDRTDGKSSPSNGTTPEAPPRREAAMRDTKAGSASVTSPSDSEHERFGSVLSRISVWCYTAMKAGPAKLRLGCQTLGGYAAGVTAYLKSALKTWFSSARRPSHDP